MRGICYRPSVLSWFRRRQRALATGMLTVFCLAWLQLAALPCAYAFASGTSSGTTALTWGPGQHVPADINNVASVDHCPYCPPGDRACGDDRPVAQEACAVPNSPQVDARLAIAFASALPATPLLAWQVRLPDVDRPEVGSEARASVPPRASVSIRLCRFLK